jgi:polysaccharide biosynthesis/export protein
MRYLSLLIIGALIFFSSCRTQRPTAVNNYLQSTRDTTIEGTANYIPVIRKGDLLAIRVYSAANGRAPQADAPYNLNADPGTGTSGQGFLVDEKGNIEYPQVGLIKAEGLSRDQLAELIKGKLTDQLTQPSVVVRFINFRVTVLGEVRAPGSFTLPTERITIFDALGLAGDMTDFGRRDNVKVVRESNGVREVAVLNLTKDSVFTSPFYRLQQNDMVFVDQLPQKIRQQERQQTAQQIGIFSSVIAAAALILNIIR